MAVLQKLRGWGIILSLLVALPLLLFIIDPQQIMQTVQSVSSRNDVGKINGKPVSYMDFQGEVEKFSTINEIMTGQSASSDAQQRQIRDAAWQSLIDENLFIPQAVKAGLNVGSAEMVDLTTGDAVSPLLASNPLFLDEEGQFSAQKVQEFVQAVTDGEADGRYGLYWNYLQTTVRNAQYYNKYNALFTAASQENALSLRNRIAENNNTADVRFVMTPFSYVTDSTVVVSDKEIKEYYKNHKDFFKQQNTRDMEYVVFEVVPSAKDIQEQNEAFAAQYNDFATTDNLRSFLQRNSDRQWSDHYYKAGELNSVNREVEEFVSSHNNGVSPVFQSGNTFYAARVVEVAQVPDSVFVRHLMFQGADAKNLADSLLTVLQKNRKTDFSSLAAVYSADKGSAADGVLGNIGWMTQNYMIPGFESVITAKVGVPYIINTIYGTHIVEVTKATKPVLKKKVAIFEKETIASKETFNTFYNQANRFATIAAGTLSGYRAAVDSTSAYSHRQTIYESTDSYGSIDHAKEITRWCFDQKKAGKASGIITVDNNYFFVVAVTGAKKEGYTPVEDVASSIRSRLYQEKYAEKRRGEIAAEIEGLTSLDEIAEKLGTTVSTQEGVAFSSMASRSLDPRFVGAISAAKEGEISGPVAGSYGVYVFEVTGRDTGSYYTEDDAVAYQKQMTGYQTQMILPAMMEQADVKDNRARFY